VQQQDARKNYIGIVSDTTEDERIADTAVRSQPHVVSWSDASQQCWDALARARRDAPPRLEARRQDGADALHAPTMSRGPAGFRSFELDNETFV